MFFIKKLNYLFKKFNKSLILLYNHFKKLNKRKSRTEKKNR